MRKVLLLSLFIAVSGNALPQQKEETEKFAIGEVKTIPNLDPAFRFELEEALQRKDFEKAEQLLVKEIETNKQAPKYHLLSYLGGLFFVDKKYLNSAIAYKKADAIESLDPGNRFTLAMSYILLGRRDWARPELDRLNREQAARPLYAYWLARLDYDENLYEPAIGKLEQIIQEHPSFTRAYDRLGLCYEALGKTDKAIAYYEKAIELNRQEPNPSAWPSLNLGVLLMQAGQAEKAEGYLREAIRIEPGFAQAHYRLGLALEKLNRLEESVAAMREAARLDPAYPDPHWALARVLRRTGDREGAEQAVRDYQRLKKEQKGS